VVIAIINEAELLKLSETMTPSQLAARYGVSTAIIRRHLDQLHEDGLPCARKSKLPPDRELVQLYETMTQAEIGARYGVTRYAVSKALWRARENLGVKALRRSKGGAGRPPGSRDSPPKGYDGPPYDELDDALRRWGIDGCAEEYDVTPAQVAEWMKVLDL
jgi:hypothetical protein